MMEAYISTVWRRGSLVDEKICSQHIHCTSARILLERWNKRSANDVEICGYGCMSDTTKFSGKKNRKFPSVVNSQHPAYTHHQSPQ